MGAEIELLANSIIVVGTGRMQIYCERARPRVSRIFFFYKGSHYKFL